MTCPPRWGDNPGEIDLGCHAVPKAKSYLIEMREHSDITAPGAWGAGEGFHPQFGNDFQTGIGNETYIPHQRPGSE
jgi:hypothetical protein